MKPKPKSDSTIPISNPDIERAVLACCLIDPNAIIRIPKVKAKMFYEGRYEIIFTAMQELVQDGSPVDIETVSERLMRMGKLLEIGGDGELAGLSNNFIATAAHVEEYAKRLIVTAACRHLDYATRGIRRRIEESGYDPEEVMDYLVDRISKIQDALADGTELKFRDMIAQTISDVKATIQSSAGVTLIKTGFPYFDRLTGGIALEELHAIAGDASVGKSDLMINWSITLSRAVPVGIISAEMGSLQLGRRFLSNLQGLDSLKLRSGEVTTTELQQLDDCLKIADKDIYIDLTTRPTPLGIKSIAHRWKQRYGVKILFVDNLTKVRPGTQDNRLERMEEVLESMAALARDLHIAVIMLHHLNRNLEQREKQGRPTLHSLNWAGDKTYDCVYMLWRQGWQDDGDEDNLEILLRKMRGGKVGRVNCRYELPSGRIGEWEYDEMPEKYKAKPKKEKSDVPF